jgi:hypothetical protein
MRYLKNLEVVVVAVVITILVCATVLITVMAVCSLAEKAISSKERTKTMAVGLELMKKYEGTEAVDEVKKLFELTVKN